MSNSESNYTSCPKCGGSVAKAARKCSGCGAFIGRTKRIVGYVFVGLIVLVAVAAVVGSDGKKQLVTNSATDQGQAEAAAIEKLIPADQKSFANIVDYAAAEAKNSENDVKKGKLLVERNKNICALKIGNINDWVGTIRSITTNSDGHGVLSVKVSDHGYLTTWNNALSDVFDGTLIKPGSAIHNTIAELNRGDLIKFSGNFVENDETCVGEQSLTLNGKIRDPEFTFQFGMVSPMNY
jgi:hypothetical protein